MEELLNILFFETLSQIGPFGHEKNVIFYLKKSQVDTNYILEQ